MFSESFWQSIEQEKSRSIKPFLERRKKNNPMRPQTDTLETAEALAPELPPIRDRIFDSEFARAASDVLAHSSENGTDLHISESEAFQSLPENDKQVAEPGLRFDRFRIAEPEEALDRYLLDLYERPSSAGAFLNLWTRQIRADACCFLVLGSKQLEYRPVLSSGVDQETLTRLRFSIQDHYFEPGGMMDFPFDEGPGLDRYFRKRFSSKLLAEFAGCTVYHRQDIATPVLLVLFYRSLAHRERPEQYRNSVQSTLEALMTFLAAEVTLEDNRAGYADLCERSFTRLSRFLRRNSSVNRVLFQFEGLVNHPRKDEFLKELELSLRGRNDVQLIRLFSDRILLFCAEEARVQTNSSITALAQSYGLGVHEIVELLDDKTTNPYVSLL